MVPPIDVFSNQADTTWAVCTSVIVNSFIFIITLMLRRGKKFPENAVNTVFEFWCEYFTAVLQGSEYEQVT